MLGSFAGEGEWRDVEAANGRAGGAHLDGGHAGNDGGHADGDEELVGAGIDLLEDVLAADVGARGARDGEETEEDDEECAERELHRCTLRIQRPKLRPTQVPMEP